MDTAVLFDLDGTLADTAADPGAALNHVRMEEGLLALPAAAIRPQVSNGVRGLLKVGFGLWRQQTRPTPTLASACLPTTA